MSSSFPLDGMRVRFAGDSNVGMKRAHNEDSFFLPESERLAIVADGMGGHASGEVASRMAVDTIVGFFKATQDDQQLTWPFKMDHGQGYDVNRLITGIKLANLKIHEQAQKDPRCHGMGTTVVSTLFLDRRARSSGTSATAASTASATGDRSSSPRITRCSTTTSR